MEYKTVSGTPSPLGATRKNSGVNFAIYSEHATAVRLALYTPHQEHPFFQVSLDPAQNKTGHIWHVLIKNLPEHVEYGYFIEGPNDPQKGLIYDSSQLVIDPYAYCLATSINWGANESYFNQRKIRGRLVLEREFDWEGVTRPNIPLKDLVIYEMHVRGFTKHSSSGVAKPGTFLGVIEKIPYLKKLGINAVELLPLYEFNESENLLKSPDKERLYNYWGYSTINFFSPMNRYASSSDWDASIKEFKTMVKELHKNKIEVILDVVYNHTSEGNLKGHTICFRNLDNPVYYMLNDKGEYYNFSGTGNTFNCNNPPVANLVVDSLKYWVSEMHVDGFRFDLASILTRAPNGAPLADPPVVRAISTDPVFANTKLIAEAWDAAGLYQVGSFPSYGKWAEWNGIYRDVVRKFIKGTDKQAGAFSGVICGSRHLYEKDRKPYHSINFVIAHDGFTLKDLVSYQEKHNLENGENNQDGANDNESWNCGQEGPSNSPKINQLRKKQMKNFHLALLLSIGTPMVHMGDEYGHTRHGNNNGWGHDDVLNWFLWDHQDPEFFRFCSLIIEFRKKHASLLNRTEFLADKEIVWHGMEPGKPDWGDTSRFVAYTLIEPSKREDLYIAFNAHFNPAHVHLPPPPENKKWYRIIYTELPSPNDYLEDPRKEPLKFTYNMEPHSAFVAQAF